MNALPRSPLLQFQKIEFIFFPPIFFSSITNTKSFSLRLLAIACQVIQTLLYGRRLQPIQDSKTQFRFVCLSAFNDRLFFPPNTTPKAQ